MSFWKNIRVLYQVYLISAVSLAGFAIVGIIYFIGQSNQETILKAAEFRLQGKVLVEEIAYDFLNSRRSEKDFVIRLNKKYAKKHAGIVAKATPQIEQLRQYYPEAESQKHIDVVSAKFAAYAQQFTKVTAGWGTFGLDSKSGLRGTLRKSVHAVETKLKEFDQPQLMVVMLMMRRHEKDFFMRISEKYLGSMDKRLAEFTTALDTSTIPADAKTDIAAKMASYHKDFKTSAKVRLQIVPDTKMLSKLFADAAPSFKALRENAAKDVVATEAEAQAVQNTTRNLMYMVMLIVAVLVGLLSTVVGRVLANSIKSMTGAMQQLAGGDITVEIPAQDRDNELGEMAKATNVFKENMIENDRMTSERQAAQDAEQKRAQKLESMTASFGDSVTGALENVSESATRMESTALSMSATAEQTTKESQMVSTAANDATANVQTVASAAEELSSSIGEIGRQVQQSTVISANAVKESERANEMVQGLATAADKIGEVVSLITDIAEQTNLLALNATIEAARAGDAGKGFAVVASEVKNLANQTAKATEEIGAQIGGIQSATQDSVQAIQNIGKTIGEVSEIASTIAAAVEEQGAATQEIARNVEQASNGTSTVSSNIASVTKAAEQTGSASMEVVTAANDMSDGATALNKQVETFLADIRAI